MCDTGNEVGVYSEKWEILLKEVSLLEPGPQ